MMNFYVKSFLVASAFAFTSPVVAQEADEPKSDEQKAREERNFKEKLREKRRQQEAEEKKRREINNALFNQFRQALLSADVQIRETALDSIVVMKDVDKEHLIIKALEDDSSKIRLKVLDYFKRYKTQAHLDAMSHVVGDPNIEVRKKLVDVILNYTVSSDQKFNTYSLIQSLLEDKQSEVRMQVIQGLKKFKDEHFRSRSLFDAVQSAFFDSDSKIRKEAFEIINRFSFDYTHDFLETALNDTQIHIREKAQEIVSKEKGKRAQKLLSNTLNDSYNPIREKAIKYLTERMDDSVVRLFDNHLLGEKNYQIRIQLLESLSRKPSPLVVGIISRSVNDPVVKVRRRAADLLQEMQKRVNRAK